MTKFVTEYQHQLSKSPLELQFKSTDGLKNVQKQLDDAFGKFKAKSPVDIDALGKTVGRQLTSPAQVTQATKELEDKAKNLRSQIADAQRGGKQSQQIQGQIDVVRKNIDQPGRQANRSLFGDDDLKKQFDSAVAQFDALRNKSDLTKQDVNQLFASMQKVNDAAQSSPKGKLGFGGSLEQLGQAVNLLNQLQQSQQKAAGLSQFQTQLQSIESVLQRVKGTDISTPFQTAANAITSSVAGAQQLAGAMEAGTVGSGTNGSSGPTGSGSGGSRSGGSCVRVRRRRKGRSKRRSRRSRNARNGQPIFWRYDRSLRKGWHRSAPSSPFRYSLFAGGR